MRDSITDIISGLTALGHRQHEAETKAADFIIGILNDLGIDHAIQRYTLYVPRTIKAVLRADGKKIECHANCFVSGKIEGKNNIVSNLLPLGDSRNAPNINFNPRCDAISDCTFYDAPALSIARKDIPTILKAKNVSGEARVARTKHNARNILVGNLKNPKNLIFTHYDSVNKGAVDNASGVAVVIRTLIENPELKADNLFAICAAEELSYDKPHYWCAGYRRFEDKYPKLLKKSKKIIVVDSAGHTKPELISDPELLSEGFVIMNLKKYEKKTRMLAGNIDKLMEIYHSDLDDISGIKIGFMEESKKMLIKQLSK